MTEDLSLPEQISRLSIQIEHLNQRVSQLEHGSAVTTIPVGHTELEKTIPEIIYPGDESSILAGGSSLLRHISAVCFLMVFGLGLRALADNEVLGQLAGTILGLSYAALLLVVGYVLYVKRNSMAALFTVIGAVLIFSVLMETYTRFSALPVEIVYSMLALTGISLAFISFHQKTALPIIVGSLGMCLTAVAIDYPNPYFPYLGLMLWLSNILGFFASRIKRCSWLRWVLMLTTHFMLQIWGLKISGVLAGTASHANIAASWFVPIITLIGFTFVMISFFGIIRSGDEKISKFDLMLPAINAAWCYVAGIYALKNPELFGVPAAFAATFHFALVFWLAQRQRDNAPGTNTFTTGGVILAGLSLPALMGGMLLPLPFLSALALAIAACSNIWKSGGMRVTSYTLQFYVCLILLIEAIDTIASNTVPIMSVALICSWLAFQHYRFCRRTPPPPESLAFSRYDPLDRFALSPLITSLAAGLVAILAAGYFFLSRNYPGDIAIAYIGLQSLIVNGSAILLIIIAAILHDKELRNMSCVILVIGGLKVFIYDMLQISGSWLVVGLFAFGTAAALQSIILARWKPDASDNTETDQLTPI